MRPMAHMFLFSQLDVKHNVLHTVGPVQALEEQARA